MSLFEYDHTFIKKKKIILQNTSQVTYVTMVLRDTASPRGRYAERRQRDPCLKHTYKNKTCWPATAYDIITKDHSTKDAGRIHHPLLRLKLASEA